MNWIERMYEIKGKDLYSQNGEGLLLEYILMNFTENGITCSNRFVDIGAGDKFVLSNVRHLVNFGYRGLFLERSLGDTVTTENILGYIDGIWPIDLLSVDIDGNDYWILEKVFSDYKPKIVIAEFNPAFTDSRTIAYNPNHEWDGTDYYGFSFEAGKKLAEKHGYEIIFNVANMNLIMVRKDLIGDLYVPPVTYEQVKFFKESNRTDWEWI